MADSSSVVLRYIEESEWGVTPTVALKTVVMNSFNPGYEKNSIQSQRISADPQLRHKVRGTHGGAPSVGGELSFTDMDDFLALFLRGAWTGDVLENGSLRPSMSLEAHYSDIDKYIAVKGARPATMNISAAIDQMIGCEFTFQGLAPIPAEATIGTGGPVAAPDLEPFNTVDHITLIQEGGSTIGDVFGFDLSVDLAARRKQVLGTPDPLGIGLGTLVATGTLSMHFEDIVHYLKLINHTESSFTLRLVDTNGNQQDWSIPRLVYDSGNPDLTGPNIDIPLALAFTAMRDPTTGKTIRIERTAGYS